MINIYPLFERNRILKKELLWSLRDYSFSHIQLEYQEYGQGILRGCDISVQGDQLAVGPGIIKCGRFICLMMEEERILYQPAEGIQYLKYRIKIDKNSQDSILYHTNLVLDMDKPQKENEFELCRFHLRSGAQLRVRYKDFKDMETEYDTINLIHADWGGLGGKAVSPVITRCFAKAVLVNKNSKDEDRFFAYLCLNQPGALPIEVLSAYSDHRINKPAGGLEEPSSIYQCLCIILDGILKGKEQDPKEKKERRHILVD